MTEGIHTAVDGDRITCAVSSTRSALPANSRTTALRALQICKGSKVWFRINTRRESIERRRGATPRSGGTANCPCLTDHPSLVKFPSGWQAAEKGPPAGTRPRDGYPARRVHIVSSGGAE